MEFGSRMDRRCRAVLGLAAGLSLLAFTAPALSAEPDWPSGTYRYIVIDQSVRDALIELGRNIDVPVDVSDQVKGRLSAGMPIGTAREFLQWVCDRYGLVWYYDGSRLHIATEGEVQTEMVKLDSDSMQGVRGRLQALGIVDPRYPIRVAAAEDVISVSGPPAYVETVKKALGVLREPAHRWAREVDGSKPNVVPVRVFRGKRAEAETVPASRRQGESE